MSTSPGKDTLIEEASRKGAPPDVVGRCAAFRPSSTPTARRWPGRSVWTPTPTWG
ncbi:hypothetical protein ACFQV4_23280 [Streptomyces thermocarboxydus]